MEISRQALISLDVTKPSFPLQRFYMIVFHLVRHLHFSSLVFISRYDFVSYDCFAYHLRHVQTIVLYASVLGSFSGHCAQLCVGAGKASLWVCFHKVLGFHILQVTQELSFVVP